MDKHEGENFNNFIKTTDYSVFRNKYVFFDAKDRVSDALFTKLGIPVRIKKEYAHPDKRYVVVLCSIKKKDSLHFEQALNDLKNKLLLLGYRDYGCFCNEIMGLLKTPCNIGCNKCWR